MDVPLDQLCLSSEEFDINIRIQSLEALGNYNIDEIAISNIIIPRLLKYLDDSEEVLLIVIKQLLNLKHTVSTPANIYSLFIPIEILSNIIDEPVRNAAVKGIIELLKFYNLTENYTIVIINNLSYTQQSYSIYSAIEIIEEIFPIISLSMQEAFINYLLSAFNTKSILIRSKIASTISNLAKNMLNSLIFGSFIELFFNDSEDAVRIFAVDMIITLKIDIGRYLILLNDQS